MKMKDTMKMRVKHTLNSSPVVALFTINLYFYTKYKILNKRHKSSVDTDSKNPTT